MKKKIPFNRVDIQGNELDYIKSIIDRGHISGDSHYTEKSSSFLKSILHTSKVLLTTSSAINL